MARDEGEAPSVSLAHSPYPSITMVGAPVQVRSLPQRLGMNETKNLTEEVHRMMDRVEANAPHADRVRIQEHIRAMTGVLQGLDEANMEKVEGDFVHRARKVDRIYQFDHEQETTWGNMTLRMVRPEEHPDYLLVRDVDGVSGGMITLKKFMGEKDPTLALMTELDERHRDMLEEL